MAARVSVHEAQRTAQSDPSKIVGARTSESLATEFGGQDWWSSIGLRSRSYHPDV